MDWYNPVSDRKSGMPLSVDTPAPPKKTNLRLFSTIFLNVEFILLSFLPRSGPFDKTG